MFVIFPAEDLILMTYGAAIPRISPRPTLDCLRDPQVPIVVPARSLPPSSPSPSSSSSPHSPNPLPQSVSSVREFPSALPAPFPPITAPDNSNSVSIISQGDIVDPAGVEAELSLLTGVSSRYPYPGRSLLPTISERNSPSVHTPTSTPPSSATPVRRSSRSSQRRSNPTQRAPIGLRQIEEEPLREFPPISNLNIPMYNDLNMRSSQQQQQYPEPMQGASRSGFQGSPLEIEYPTGSLQRSRSPSIFLEPSTPDPTQPRLGPGWGRPMSPMDLPPEPSTSQKSPSSKSRLRPKLHIPLGRLGRSTSSDQRESYRLREDLELQVENPVFNTENLRQRNFDAFFDSGEPVYKLQPKTPFSTSSESSPGGGKLSPALDNYAGVYDSSPRKGRGANAGGLFARSNKEDQRQPEPRTKSSEFYDPAREVRSASVDPASVSMASGGVSTSGVPQKDFLGKSSSGPKSRNFFGWRGPLRGSPSPKTSMASHTGVLKDYGHSSLNEAFKSHNNVNFKLIKTVSDFTETLSHLYEDHATALQTLVTNYRKKNAELRKERPACHLSIFQAWETFLQEVETDSQASNDVAHVLYRQVSRPMLDKSFHRKVQSRKIFTHRESFETIIAKTEEKLSKCRLDYKQCYVAHRQNATQQSLTEYIDAHNAYVQQLHATNAMLETYQCETVPQLMQELEDIHNDLCSIIADSLQQGADVMANKASDQARRYSSLTSQCATVSPVQDLTNFVRILPPLPTAAQRVQKRPFAPAAPVEQEDNGEHSEMAPALRNELVFDRHSSASLRVALESLKREAMDLEMQIRQLQDAIDVLNRQQIRGIEGQLFNKVNETQEDLSMSKFDLRAKQLHLSAIRAQKELFVSKLDPGSPRGERKLSAATAPSMKTKWLKAIKSLKPASGSAVQSDRRNGAGGSSQPLRPNEDGSHHLQEYTYKKITACDVCSQILRGHTRQGLRCRICKLNAHGDCASQLPRCQPKQKLLRRQKSTSELENRVDVEEETDKSVQNAAKDGLSQSDIPIVNVPECPERSDRPSAMGAGGSSASGRPVRSGVRPPPVHMPILGVQLQQQELSQQWCGTGLGGGGGLPVPTQDISSSSAPHSPRRQKLNLRMKSLSLDSPESSELHGQIRRRQPPVPGPSAGAASSYYHGGSGGHLEHSTPPSNNSRLHSPSSPSHQGRKLLYASRGMRGGSVDLPDEMEKSQSSASTSPCPSPKSHRLLPTNLYVILYNFKARHTDELDLKAGYKVTVIDTSDPDWWKGKVLGRVGYFPSKYCVRLNANEKPLQVTHNLQVSDGERGENMTLLRDQIVIQTGDEVNGMVMVRSADNRQGYCPIKYLQEV
uniref:Stac-like n=1 Tax=Stomoxys calcitrans TaxID=35570 RepID=A0A1I8PL17_STOCA